MKVLYREKLFRELDRIFLENNQTILKNVLSSFQPEELTMDDLLGLWNRQIKLEDTTDENIYSLCKCLNQAGVNINLQKYFSFPVSEDKENLFNKDMKNRYLDTIQEEGERLRVQRLFRLFSDFENALGKDIAEFNIENVRNVFESFDYEYANTFRSERAKIMNYIRWVNAFYPNVNVTIDSLDQIKPHDIISPRAIKKSLIKSPDELKKLIMEYSPPSVGRYSCPLVCFAWCGAGVTQEALDVKNSDVDFGNNKIKIKDKMYDIPDQLAEILLEYNNIQQIEIKRGQSYQTLYKDDIGFFIKRFCVLNSKQLGVPLTENSMRVSLNEFFVKIRENNGACDYSFDSINFSGKSYRLFQIEKSGEPLTDELVKTVFEIGENSSKYTKVLDVKNKYMKYKQEFWE